MRALRYVLEQGQGAMVLVPEISLTPQLIGRFRAVLGEAVEVLHSNLSDGERLDAWQRLHDGKNPCGGWCAQRGVCAGAEAAADYHGRGA